MTKAVALVKRDPDLDEWADRIVRALNKTVEGIFETGKQLLAARERLEHGQWEQLFTERRVPMSARSARMFIEIYKRRDVLLSNRKHVSDLPSSWGTLYELARLPDDTLSWAYEQHKITSDLERKEIKQLRAEYDGAVLPSTRRETVSLGIRTPGSRLVTDIEQRLLKVFERLSADDRDYVISMLRQTLERLAAPSSEE